MPRARFGFDGCITRALFGRLVFLVLLVVPCKTGLDLLEPDVDHVRAGGALAFGREHAADDASEAVALVPHDPHRLCVNEIRQMFFGALAVGLALLGRIDAREPDPVLLMKFVEDR